MSFGDRLPNIFHNEYSDYQNNSEVDFFPSFNFSEFDYLKNYESEENGFNNQDEKYVNRNYEDNKPQKEIETFFEDGKIKEYKTNFSNTKTKIATQFLQKKTKRSKEDTEKTKNNINGLGDGSAPKKSNQGRKKRDEKDKGNHTKFSEDNIMRKIKSYFLNNTHSLLNESIKDKNLNLLKLDSFINKNLKKEYNLNLYNTKMKDLYLNSKISSKYRSQIISFADKNQKILKKIYEEQKETQTIKLLNLSYKDLFNVFRKNIININEDLENKIKDIPLLQCNKYNDIYLFFDEIIRQEIRKGETLDNINIYINNMKNLCMNYESWFLNKKGRNRTSKLKN